MKTIIGTFVLFGILSYSCSSSDDDNVGTPIETVTPITEVSIGTQIWFQKNLDVSCYRNGDLIPQVQDSVAWSELTTGAWCYYNNDPTNRAIYGKLYNGYAMLDPRGLAPEGWHIPDDTEWTTLMMYLGEIVAGDSMKATSGWSGFHNNGSNSSGFTGLPGGRRANSTEAPFVFAGECGYWWSITPTSSNSCSYWMLNSSMYLYNFSNYLGVGKSVRCLKN